MLGKSSITRGGGLGGSGLARLGMFAFADKGLPSQVEGDVAAAFANPATAGLINGIGTTLKTRFSTVSGEIYFEVGFTAGAAVTGSALTGWSDHWGHVILALLWSEDEVTWSEGMFVDCPSSPAANGDGTFTWWSRARYPRDSTTKTATISCASPGVVPPNASNNPFTALTINSTAQTLPNFPYTMPGNASQLQTDLVAAGWTGATVTASSATVWAITVPNVTVTTLTALNKIFWASYLAGTDPMGVNVYSDGGIFTGSWVNGAGIRTAVQKQFARLRARVT